MKKDFTVEDVYQRAEATLRECLVNGTTRMRTQLEIDPAVGLRSFEAVRALAADYKWAIDLEICVFPQDGMTNYPGTEELLVEALKQGAPVLGARAALRQRPGGADRARLRAGPRVRRRSRPASRCRRRPDADAHLPGARIDRALQARRPGRRRAYGEAVAAAAGRGRGAGAAARRCRHRGDGIAGDRPLSDGARARPRGRARRRRRQSARAPTASPARCRATTC